LDDFKIVILFWGIGVASISFASERQDIKNLHRAPYPKIDSTTIDTNVILPPSSAFGIIYRADTNQQQTIELIDQMIEHDYPIDACW